MRFLFTYCNSIVQKHMHLKLIHIDYNANMPKLKMSILFQLFMMVKIIIEITIYIFEYHEFQH
jgi:hypothetical protein